MSPSTKHAQTSSMKWQPKGEKSSKAVNAASKKHPLVAESHSPSLEAKQSPVVETKHFPGLAKAVLKSNQMRRRSSDDEETCLESEEVSICSSGDESWRSNEAATQNGRAAGKQLLSLLHGGDDAAQAPTTSGKTKLSLGAAAFCPGARAQSNPQQAPTDKLGQMLGNLREKLSEDDPAPPGKSESPIRLPTPKASMDPSQLAPKRYSTFDPLKQMSSTPPSDSEEKAPVSPAKPKRTPLSVKAAAFQPRQFIPGNSVPFAPPGSFAMPQPMAQPWINANGFQLTFSTEMPPCSFPSPTLDAPQEHCAQQTPFLPFESLLGDYEVSNGILVAKCQDACEAPQSEESEQSPGHPKLPVVDNNGAYTSSAEDDSGACASSPASTCTSTPAPPQQKISWADLSDDEDSCPWMNLESGNPTS
jgi:hypothetical protein